MTVAVHSVVGLQRFLALIRDGVHPLSVVSFTVSDQAVTITISLHLLDPRPPIVRYAYTLEASDYERPADDVATEIVRQYRVDAL
jgi:hypothetical protein